MWQVVVFLFIYFFVSSFLSLQLSILTGRRTKKWSIEEYYMIINLRYKKMNTDHPVNEGMPTEFVIIFLHSKRVLK